jgi:hypothetical protein
MTEFSSGKEQEMIHHHRLKRGRETKGNGGNGLGGYLDKLANRQEAIRLRVIVCGCKVLCDIECSLHTSKSETADIG